MDTHRLALLADKQLAFFTGYYVIVCEALYQHFSWKADGDTVFFLIEAKMKIVIPGGTGFLGRLLVESFLADSEKHDIVVLSRGGARYSQARLVPWDARTLGEWAREIEGADAVINLTGKNVKCLYTDENIKKLRNSRILSTEVVGQAIKQAKSPPPVWLQMSAVSIYAHRLNDNPPHDEEKGQTGEASTAPLTWKSISRLVQDWESALYSAQTPETVRKTALRCGVIMGLNPGGAFNIFLKLSRYGLGGSIAGGKQMISWLHESDFVSAIRFVLKNTHIKGPVNLCSPHPLPQAEFMKILREKSGAKWGLPAPKWAVVLSSYLTGIDSELSLKSRYVIPKVLTDNRFNFQFPHWPEAVKHLLEKQKKT